MEQRGPQEEREFLIATWSADYADRSTAWQAAARFHDEGFAMNYECNRMLNHERNAWQEPELARRCREIRVPVLVVHGELDPRPSWGTETLVEALPDVERVVLEGAGHLPWIEREEALRDALRGFVAKVAA